MEKSEIERVTFIHAKLDYAAAAFPEGRETSVVWGIQRHEYTAAEVRAWPELKARLAAELRRDARFLYVTLLGDGTVGGGIIESSGLDHSKQKRGMMMWREMLATPSAEEVRKEWVPKVGDRVQTTARWCGEQHAGICFEVVEVRQGMNEPVIYGKDGFAVCLFDLEPAPVAPAKATHCKRCSIENDGHYVTLDPNGHCGHCVADLMNEARGNRTWDSDKYNGIVRSDLDARIAVARAELDDGDRRRAWLAFPHVGRNFALRYPR
jgi:hypothetical protein